MQCTILCGVRNKSPSMRCTPLLLAISTVYPFPYHGLLYSGRSPVYFLATSLPCSPSLGETESDRVRQSQTESDLYRVVTPHPCCCRTFRILYRAVPHYTLFLLWFYSSIYQLHVTLRIRLHRVLSPNWLKFNCACYLLFVCINSKS